MIFLFYIGVAILIVGFILTLIGEVKGDFVIAQLGGLSLLCGLFIAVLAGPPKGEKPSIKAGQVWLIGDDNPFNCDTVEVLKVSSGYVLFADIREIRFKKSVDELRDVYNDNRLSYILNRKSCSIEKFVADGRQVK